MTSKRRDFLKTSIAGVAGAAVLPACSGGSNKLSSSAPATEVVKEAPPAPAEPVAKLITRKLGNTGIELPIISVGAMSATDPALLRAALDGGVKHLDTAHVYQGGRNEEMVGEVMKGRPRDSVVISTKVPAQSSAKEFVTMFETSLERLGLDYVDILYLHSAKSRDSTLDQQMMNEMVKFKEQGKVRHLGVSTHRNEPEVLRAAIESKVYEVVLTAYNFRQAHRDEVKKAIAEAAAAGLGIVAMKTQAGVFFDKERTKPINMKAALKWALQNPNVHTAIPGITTFEQLELDLAVLNDTTLTPAEETDLAKGEETAGLYCSQCGECASQCDQGVDVPTLMRGYMYTYGYANPAEARAAIDALGLAKLPCTDCTSCTVSFCPNGLDVAQRIADVSRIATVPREFLV